MTVPQQERLKSANLLNVEEDTDFCLQVSSFRFIRAEDFFVFEGCGTHSDNISFDALRGLNDPRAGRQYGVRKDRHLVQNCVLCSLG